MKLTRSRSTPARSSWSATRPCILRPLTRTLTRLDAAQVPDDLGVDPGDRRELAGPVVAVVGPGDPGRLVRLPFGGHPVAERGGGLVLDMSIVIGTLYEIGMKTFIRRLRRFTQMEDTKRKIQNRKMIN